MIERGEGPGFGRNIDIRIYGASHADRIGVLVKGIEAGKPVDMEKLRAFLERRAPGKNSWSTVRQEDDVPEFLSGIEDGRTTGDVIEAVIINKAARPSDYRCGGSGLCADAATASSAADPADYPEAAPVPRPSHADYPAWVRYGQIESGGGHFSGRMTAPLCIAGGLFIQWLDEIGIRICAHISGIGNIMDDEMGEGDTVEAEFPTVSSSKGDEMKQHISRVKCRGDSIGGIIECKAFGLPAGIGEPLFGSLEGMIAQSIFAVPAVKGIEFGRGFESAEITGSENNDAFRIKEGKVVTATNNHGGILGGMSSGMPLVVRVAIKPTPSICREQDSVDLIEMKNTKVRIEGRHDPCIVPRAVPCVEAAVAIALYDALTGRGSING